MYMHDSDFQQNDISPTQIAQCIESFTPNKVSSNIYC